MNEIKIPDIKIVFDNVGCISFPNIKEIPVHKLVDIYYEFQRALRQMPSVISNKDGDILGCRR